MATQSPVPTFYLYGEPHRSAAENFLHVERLADRSLPADWTIRPHAHRDLNHLFVLESGGGTMQADGELSRWFYVEVGAPHGWTDNLGRSSAEWQAWAKLVETWVATVTGERAGYYELLPAADSVEVAYFGLLPGFHGQGLGGHLLTHALRRALELAPRVWLHTNTRDGAAALPNYLARGLRPFRHEAYSKRR